MTGQRKIGVDGASDRRHAENRSLGAARLDRHQARCCTPVCGPGFEHPNLDFVRHALNRGMLEQHRCGELDLQSFPDLGQDDHRGKRSAAELEKIVLQADAFPAERSRPNLRDGGLGRARRSQRRAADASSLGKGLAVHFSIGRQRQGIELLP